MSDNVLPPGTTHAPAAPKAVYEKPAFHRIGAEEAETGINFGPETLILLS